MMVIVHHIPQRIGACIISRVARSNHNLVLLDIVDAGEVIHMVCSYFYI